MSPLVPILLQGLVLVLLYLFVWRVGRAALREIRAAGPAVVEYRTEPPSQQPSTRGSSPRPDRARPRELVVHHTGRAPEVVALDAEPVTLGRSSRGLRIDDAYASDRHARIQPQGADWVLVDLESTNDTFLNTIRLTEPATLAAGDQIGIGDTVVEVRR